MKLNEVRDKAYATSSSNGFWDAPEPNIPEKLALIHSEVSEALEEIRSGGSTSGVHYTEAGKPEGFASELADVIIRVGDLCGHLGIDLEEIVRIKMEYNASRPYKHGRKF